MEQRLRERYQSMPSEANSEEDWIILTLTVITTFRLAFAKSARSNKTASAFICFAVFLPLNLLIMHDKQKDF